MLRKLSSKETIVYNSIVKLEDKAIDHVREAILAYVDIVKTHVERYPLSTLDEPENLRSETSYLVHLPNSHVCETYLDKIECLIKALYQLQPLV